MFSPFLKYFFITAFPNSKISPPKRGDSDFKLRSKKLNSAYDMLEDSLRSKVDQHCEALLKHFQELDTARTGFVSKEKFKVRVLFDCNLLKIHRQFICTSEHFQLLNIPDFCLLS